MSGVLRRIFGLMARKLVLTGPAAEAVERLARSAGVSPSELIKRALRREDEAQRGEAEESASGAQMSQPSPAPQVTQTPRGLGSDTPGRSNPHAGFRDEESIENAALRDERSVVNFDRQAQQFEGQADPNGVAFR